MRGGDEDRETELKAVNNVSCLMPLNDNTDGEQMDDMEDGVWGRILTVMLIEWEKCLCRRFRGYGWNLGRVIRCPTRNKSEPHPKLQRWQDD